MKPLEAWLEEQLAKAPYAAQRVAPAVAVSGAGERVLFTVGPDATKVVYVALRHGGESVRVGFAAKDRWANEEIEEAVESNGGTMTEFLEDEMEADDALEFPVQHFHEAGWFHFACDLTDPAPTHSSDRGRQLIWFYVDGFCRAILPIVTK